ncbi:TrbI/VirB10 family protein [Ramlibacter sp. H39-3-26]|uniref:TrbI/VirB10 family protein n=1 Tax=Curvibacter soli TaxID=3031331 RepID=UPI0023DC3B6D|nr:TrbI/VirB10 family protein [Ramlibacter sp. H39-3-26]MDF1486017.1 TrbI/VirB10 family protein [Ramlibacter sp. H39-3-26]
MTGQTDPMAPATAPDATAQASGVRRVNNMPMYILAGVLGTFLLIMAIVAADRSAQQNAPGTQQQDKVGSTSLFAKEIVGGQTGGFIPPAVPTMPAASLDAPPSPVLIARPESLDAPPLPPLQATQPAQTAVDEEARRIRMTKLQMLDEAVKAKTTVRIDAPRSSGSAPRGAAAQTRDANAADTGSPRQRGDDPTSAYQTRLAQIRGGGAAGAGGGADGGAPQLLQTAAPGNDGGSGGSGGKSYAQFGANGPGDRWKLDNQTEAPRSPYELRAGFVVPATLISGINSDLPGQITAQVAQSVYDTPTGKHLLIPQGARLVGMYSSDVAYGQARVLIAWQRIVFPDGKAMDIGAMPGADSAGYAGFTDQVNNHYVRIFLSAFLMSGVTAGITYSQDRNNNQNNSNNNAPSASSALSEALGQQLGQVTAQMIAKNLNIAPTLEIRPGYRFNVVVTKDMTFSKPYRPFDY